jgi:hypothetical protein
VGRGVHLLRLYGMAGEADAGASVPGEGGVIAGGGRS